MYAQKFYSFATNTSNIANVQKIRQLNAASYFQKFQVKSTH